MLPIYSRHPRMGFDVTEAYASSFTAKTLADTTFKELWIHMSRLFVHSGECLPPE